MTLFQKIIAREIPAKIISEDEDLIVFHDINPQAPVHVLLVPKRPIPRLAEATAEDEMILGKLMLKAQETAKVLGITRPDSGWLSIVGATEERPFRICTFTFSEDARSPGHQGSSQLSVPVAS